MKMYKKSCIGSTRIHKKYTRNKTSTIPIKIKAVFWSKILNKSTQVKISSPKKFSDKRSGLIFTTEIPFYIKGSFILYYSQVSFETLWLLVIWDGIWTLSYVLFATGGRLSTTYDFQLFCSVHIDNKNFKNE